MPYQYRVDALFQWIERVNGPTWGHVLDAGTGAHSLSWLATLPAASLTKPMPNVVKPCCPGAKVVGEHAAFVTSTW